MEVIIDKKKLKRALRIRVWIMLLLFVLQIIVCIPKVIPEWEMAQNIICLCLGLATIVMPFFMIRKCIALWVPYDPYKTLGTLIKSWF